MSSTVKELLPQLSWMKPSKLRSLFKMIQLVTHSMVLQTTCLWEKLSIRSIWNIIWLGKSKFAALDQQLLRLLKWLKAQQDLWVDSKIYSLPQTDSSQKDPRLGCSHLAVGMAVIALREAKSSLTSKPPESQEKKSNNSKISLEIKRQPLLWT